MVRTDSCTGKLSDCLMVRPLWGQACLGARFARYRDMTSFKSNRDSVRPICRLQRVLDGDDVCTHRSLTDDEQPRDLLVSVALRHQRKDRDPPRCERRAHRRAVAELGGIVQPDYVGSSLISTNTHPIITRLLIAAKADPPIEPRQRTSGVGTDA